jgi:SAM-dependent methyltransferase
VAEKSGVTAWKCNRQTLRVRRSASTPLSMTLSTPDILTEWKASAPRHCLDFRPAQAYQKRHLTPSTSIPLSTLHQRFSHLPPRSERIPLLVVVDTPGLFNDNPVADVLRSRGWKVSHTLFDSDELWEIADNLDILASGNEGVEYLFRASRILTRNIGLIERSVAGARALDIGCGSGRDLGFLATREFTWDVTGLDNVTGAVARARDLVNSISPSSLNDVVHAQVDSLGRITPPINGRFDLILLIRFFPRALFRRLHTIVSPGGFLLFSHFTDMDGRVYESPPVEKRVKPGEIEDMILGGSGAWKIIDGCYSEDENARPLWDVVAQYDPGS